MFIVFLRFTANRVHAHRYLDGHREWLRRGLQDGVFLLVGKLESGAGGAILAHRTTLEDLRSRLEADPFVAEDVVRPEIVGVSPSQVHERLGFLLAERTTVL